MPAEATSDRLTRVLAMMSYLSGGQAVAVSELAAHFGVSEVQILNDINLLWVSGSPGYFANDLIDFTLDDDETIVALREDQGLSRPVPFAPREALALAAAVEWLRALGTAAGPSAAAVESVAKKLRGLVPAEVAVTPMDPALRDLILETVEEKAALKISYVSASDAVTERVVVPEVLTTDGNHWYLDAWCTRAHSKRTFRVDRILGYERVEAPPAAAESRDSTPETSLQVRIVLQPRARWLAEEIPNAVVAEREDGTLEVALELSSWDWLVRRLLGLGDAVLAIAPAELAAEVRDRARAAIRGYESLLHEDSGTAG